jgi:hypothetical protein
MASGVETSFIVDQYPAVGLEPARPAALSA